MSIFPARPMMKNWKFWCWIVAIFCLASGTVSRAAGPATDRGQIDVVQKRSEGGVLPEDFTFRARLVSIHPEERTDLNWRYGGEAQGGNVFSGTLGTNLALGQWTVPVPVLSLARGKFPPAFMNRIWFITFTSSQRTTRSFEVEFEFSFQGQVVKNFKEAAPKGATVGLAIPHFRLAGGRTPDDPLFRSELCGLLQYAERRAAVMEKLPWANWPLPRKFMVVSDVSGYGEGFGYGIRHSNPAITAAEARTMHQMGANSLRSAPKFLLEMGRQHEGFGQVFGHGEISHAMGFPVPSFRKDRANNDPEAGCPFGAKVEEITKEAVQRSLEDNIHLPIEQVWALTVDEIGSVFDHSPEGKNHVDTCPRCAAAFREYVQGLGATPLDFGQSRWEQVKPGYTAGPGATVYYSRKFNNDASARLFHPLMGAFDTANARKKAALAAGDASSAVAKQPWLYSYALRGNTFLLGGHSLDFFDFYRQADNAFVYETSNTGRQIWQWDSYLCDVGRVVSQTMNKQFGVYVKPHRGAPVQRALTAVTRGATMLYWYTYGPDYWKGDSFADNAETLALASKAAHLIGKTEEALFGATWALPAEVAIVKPRCSEFLGNDAQWENAKWVYTALAHAHLPADPLDEVMLAHDDLSQYKIIYLNGSHLPRKSAEALARWVQKGGLLWTSGFGCARDEANQPLQALEPVLGLEGRTEPELWYQIERYKATVVQSFADPRAKLAEVPPTARIQGTGPYAASFPLRVGREILRPGQNTRVLAKYADGSAAMTVHDFGKGRAYVAGFYPGLEYSATVRDGTPDMSRDFDASRLSFVSVPALEVTKPVVATSVPALEGVLLRNPNGQQAVALMNWAYKGLVSKAEVGGSSRAAFGIAELKDVTISIRGAGQVQSVTSAMLDQRLPFTRDGETITLTLPQVQEGDVLVLTARASTSSHQSTTRRRSEDR
jgi:hypothetical protein